MLKWWNRLWHPSATMASEEEIKSIRLNLPGWQEDRQDQEMRIWHDSRDSVLSLVVEMPPWSELNSLSEAELRCWCRELAQARNGGLIEARRVSTWIEPAAGLIFKRLVRPRYIYTGMLIASFKGTSLVWTVVDGEHGMTGVREAVVTADLMNAGKLTIADYELSWAQDPYDPDYRGVDRSVLRFVSDHECYDRQFPEHPLSNVRRVMASLPVNIKFDVQGSRTLL